MNPNDPHDLAREFQPAALGAEQHGVLDRFKGMNWAQLIAMIEALLSLAHARKMTAAGVQRRLSPHKAQALAQHGVLDSVAGWDWKTILAFVAQLLALLQRQDETPPTGPTVAPPAPPA